MNRISISEKIREHRRKKGLSQRAFGRLMGVSAQAICKWEQEACYPDITVLPRLAELLGCSVNDFFE
ncbi:MAG: helix-turn-helix transcriptional regulator [Clostridia bacterium]|nr:helix-turn-helix transcriptional regulator [Clostridia bacterium]